VRIRHLNPEFVETFPATLNDGVLYISIEFRTCAHLCACGCGQEVVTPLSPAQWAFTYNGKDVSLRPSVGNWTLPCQSHYVLDRGQIDWARPFSQKEIGSNRSLDRSLLNSIDWHTSGDEMTSRFDIPSDDKGFAERSIFRWIQARHWFSRRRR
jgi:hypothetical protein